MENEETKQAAVVETAKPKTTTKKAATKKSTAKKQDAQSGATILEKVGKAAIARHGFSAVYVTSDGLAFAQEGDAKNHALDLKNNEIIKVTKQ